MIPKKNGNGDYSITSGQIKLWIALISIGLMIAGGGGYFANNVAANEMLDYRLSKVENTYITRTEFDLRITNINDKLDSIDKKLTSIDGKLKNEQYITQDDMKELVKAYLEAQGK